jgi:hypothetical protein
MARVGIRNATQHSCRDAVATACTEFVVAFKALFDPYRPERHYMRGPGPKWHAKHDHSPAADFDGMPALIRVRVK